MFQETFQNIITCLEIVLGNLRFGIENYFKKKNANNAERMQERTKKENNTTRFTPCNISKISVAAFSYYNKGMTQ